MRKKLFFFESPTHCLSWNQPTISLTDGSCLSARQAVWLKQDTKPPGICTCFLMHLLAFWNGHISIPYCQQLWTDTLKAFTALQGGPCPNPEDTVRRHWGQGLFILWAYKRKQIQKFRRWGRRGREGRKGLSGAPLAQCPLPSDLAQRSKVSANRPGSWASLVYWFLSSRHLHASPGQGRSLSSTVAFLSF